MTKQEYKQLINKLRRENKGKWINFTEKVETASIGIKFFNTWIQIINVSDSFSELYKGNTNMNASVKQFNNEIEKALNSI